MSPVPEKEKDFVLKIKISDRECNSFFFDKLRRCRGGGAACFRYSNRPSNLNLPHTLSRVAGANPVAALAAAAAGRDVNVDAPIQNGGHTPTLVDTDDEDGDLNRSKEGRKVSLSPITISRFGNHYNPVYRDEIMRRVWLRREGGESICNRGEDCCCKDSGLILQPYHLGLGHYICLYDGFLEPLDKGGNVIAPSAYSQEQMESQAAFMEAICGECHRHTTFVSLVHSPLPVIP